MSYETARAAYHAWRAREHRESTETDFVNYPSFGWGRDGYATVTRHGGKVKRLERLGQPPHYENAVAAGFSDLAFAAACGIVRPGFIRPSAEKKQAIREAVARFAAAPAPVLP